LVIWRTNCLNRPICRVLTEVMQVAIRGYLISMDEEPWLWITAALDCHLFNNIWAAAVALVDLVAMPFRSDSSRGFRN
jgi:hypothetical protein